MPYLQNGELQSTQCAGGTASVGCRGDFAGKSTLPCVSVDTRTSSHPSTALSHSLGSGGSRAGLLGAT